MPSQDGSAGRREGGNPALEKPAGCSRRRWVRAPLGGEGMQHSRRSPVREAGDRPDTQSSPQLAALSSGARRTRTTSSPKASASLPAVLPALESLCDCKLIVFPARCRFRPRSDRCRTKSVPEPQGSGRVPRSVAEHALCVATPSARAAELSYGRPWSCDVSIGSA